MNRQYIGARYVPIFASPVEWNSALSYEALTIVMYQNNSFTSKKPVPAGIDITNTEYWANTGNFNAQLQDCANTINTFIASNKNSINSGCLNNDDKIVWIGDSLSARPTGLVYQAQKMLPNATFYNASVNGAGFTRFNNQFIDNMDNVSPPDNNAITKVVFQGAMNDAVQGINYSTICSAIEAAVSKAKSKWPYANIIICVAGPYRNVLDPALADTWKQDADRNRYALQIVIPAYKTMSMELGCKYINNLDNMPRVFPEIFLENDGAHYTDAGYELMAGAIIAGSFDGCAASSAGYWTVPWNFINDGYTFNTGAGVYISRVNDYIGIETQALTFTMNSPTDPYTLTLTNEKGYPLAPYYMPPINVRTTINCVVTKTDNTMISASAHLIFGNYGKTTLEIRAYDAGARLQLSNIKKVDVLPFTFVPRPLTW